MDHQNYKKLINRFNKFLNINKKNINIVALSFLHVLRPQHDLIKNFNNFSFKYRITYHIKFTLIKLLKSFFKKTNKKKYFSKNLDLLIISNFTNINNLNKKNDLYFGNLQTEIQKKKINCCTVFRNFTKYHISEIIKKNRTKSYFFLEDFDSLKNEIINFFILINEFFKFKFNLIPGKKILHSDIKKFSFFNFLTGLSNLRLSNQIINFVKKNKPKIVLFTLEGHSWEKVLTYKLKEKFPNLIVIGYQFSVISKNTNSLFLRIDSKFETDFIFTKNKIHKKIFVSRGFNKNKIKVLGNLKIKNFKIIKKNTMNKNIIFCPEALDYENEVMYNFAKKCAKNIKNYNFIFRPHPSYKKKFISEYKNLIISKTSLHEDLTKSKILIYRGSSVCYEASLYNILPLYLKIKNEISIDPLYQFQKKEFQILMIRDLKKIIYNISNMKKKIRDLSRQSMQFNEKPKISVIKKILDDR